MSQCGVQRLEMERRRREALRRERVRREAMALVSASEELLRGVRAVDEQVLAREELATCMEELRTLRGREGMDADGLLERAVALHEEVRGTIALAGERAAAWTAEKCARMRRLEGLRGQVDGLREQAMQAPEVLDAVRELEVELARIRRDEVESEQLDEISGRVGAAREALDRARERREMVRDLRHVLERKGFRVTGREVQGCVVLDGVMAGGQRASFALRLDGSVDYKLDRYEGSACEMDLAAIEREMEDHCGARFSPVQVTWRAPRGPAGAARRPGRVGHRKSGERS